MEYTVVTWMQASTAQAVEYRYGGFFANAVASLRPELERVNAESRRLIDDGWKPEGPPAIRGSDFIRVSNGGSSTIYIACDIYGQRFTRQRPVAIIPPVPPTFIVPPVPKPATLVPPAVNWNRLKFANRNSKCFATSIKRCSANRRWTQNPQTSPKTLNVYCIQH